MNRQNEIVLILLANRSYLYKLLQRIFADEPNLELMKLVTNQHTKDALSLTTDEDDKFFDDYLNLLNQLRVELEKDTDELLDRLKSEYTNLMIGPADLPAPPWESVYVNSDPRLFQESTLKVRQSYLKYNFLPSNYPHEADDHISLELDFMAHLSQEVEKLFEKKELEEVKNILTDQKAFLDEHLGVWIKEFAKQIQKSKTHYFYPQTATLTAHILEVDRKLIDELLSME